MYQTVTLSGTPEAVAAAMQAFFNTTGQQPVSSEGSTGPTEFKGILAPTDRTEEGQDVKSTVTLEIKCLCGKWGNFSSLENVAQQGWEKINKHVFCPTCASSIRIANA